MPLSDGEISGLRVVEGQETFGCRGARRGWKTGRAGTDRGPSSCCEGKS